MRGDGRGNNLSPWRSDDEPHRRNEALTDLMRLSTQNQRDVLKEYAPTFTGMLEESQGTSSFKAIGIKVIQINVGKICNQACHHCHVDASPRRKETMSAEVVRQCIALIESLEEVETVDITGGAPEDKRTLYFFSGSLSKSRQTRHRPLQSDNSRRRRI